MSVHARLWFLGVLLLVHVFACAIVSMHVRVQVEKSVLLYVYPIVPS